MGTFVRHCPVFEFQPSVVHRNPQPLDIEGLGIELPEGLPADAAREPTFVSPQRMLELLRQRQPEGERVGVVHGLTRADFSLRFPDPDRQWRECNVGWSDPAWVFEGGDVLFEVAIGVFVLEGDRPREDDEISQRVFGVIMEHELEHVADAIDIVTGWMPPRAYRDTIVRRYLADGQPMTQSTYRHWIRDGNLEHRLLADLWAPEHNRRDAIRDAPENRQAVQERIEALRRRGINRP